jgi:hypothetical protein
MNELGLKSQFKNITTKARSQLYHIWSNVLGNESKLGILETYWPDFHKPICMAFKLPNTHLISNNKIMLSPFI